MNEDVIADLKQFITAVITQQTAQLRTEISSDLRAEFVSGLARVEQKLGQKIDDLSAYVAEALDTSNDTTEKQLKNHERRITRLEQKTA